MKLFVVEVEVDTRYAKVYQDKLVHAENKEEAHDATIEYFNTRDIDVEVGDIYVLEIPEPKEATVII